MPRYTEPPPGSRRVQQPHGYSIWVIGDERAVLRDAYHIFLRMPWPASLALIAAGFVAVNLVFATIYYAIGGVDGVRSGSFFDALVFSVQTLGTIGYGVMVPKSPAANTVMIVEAITSIIVTALATGLVFTKFARATARIAFSEVATVSMHEGQLTLTFRCGNRRSNTIVDASLRVVLGLTTTTVEGTPFYRLHDLKLVRDRQGAMRRGWQVMHVIDETSPLFGLDAEGLAKREAELEISLVGLDDVTMQAVHALHSYSDKQILFGKRFGDTLTALPTGDIVLDLREFNTLVDEGAPHERGSVAV